MENFTDECRCYIEHLRSEHQQIRQSLRDLQATLFATRSEPFETTLKLVKLQLLLLRDKLQRHFSAEDSGGCIEEAVSRLPRLADRANQLAGEHPRLLAQLDQIIEQIDNPQSTTTETQPIEEAIQEFSTNIMEHEAIENQLLHQGFNVSADTLENS